MKEDLIMGTFYIPRETWKQFQIICISKDVSMTAVLRKYVEDTVRQGGDNIE